MGRLLLAAFVAVFGSALATNSLAAPEGTPTEVASQFDCPVSQPNGKQPPEVADLGRMDGLGNESLWASLVMWSERPGIVEVPSDAHLLPDGTVRELKWAWYRYEPGQLTITGERLDAPAPPLAADVPDGYGLTGFQVSGITFPTDGCWQITGSINGMERLTFVLRVIYPEGFAPDATFFDCPVTEPNGIQPPPEANVFGRGNGDYGNDVLWTSLWVWGEGVVQAPDDGRIGQDGVIPDLKWPWYRFVPGEITVEGRRLDETAPPLEATFLDGYGDSGFTPSGMTFPTDGCWEVTASIGDAGSLTFVVLVRYPDGFMIAATPEASPAP